MSKVDKIVLPGEKLGVIEEFLNSSGTYTHNGYIFSALAGYARIDRRNKVVSVAPLREIPIPKRGVDVIGVITNIMDKVAAIRILKVGDKSLSSPFTGVLPIGFVERNFLKSMFLVYRAWDIIKAKVVSNADSIYYLSTTGSDYGVVYAFCTKCGKELTLVRKQQLICEYCGNKEERKIAKCYGQVKII